MSGGVDSSVAAALLKRGGFGVTGVFMKFWKEGQGGQNRCCSTESEKLARLVAQKIGVPFYVVNAKKEFKKAVVDYFLQEYKAGRTPNPCVVCNKEIKFGILMKKALALGADFVATGHYARTSLGNKFFSGYLPLRVQRPAKNSLPRSFILKALDENKDQSYFLWQLSQNQLKRALFPVGGLTKPEVRKLAKRFGLPTAETPESQEVCFINSTTNDFLKKHLKTKPGDIIDASGKKLGGHNGLWFYTIGQRKGIGLSGGPYYVVAKDFKKNSLIVSKNKKELLQKELIVKNVNWLCLTKTGERRRVEVKIRYRNKSAAATILKIKNSKNLKIIFDRPQRAITPGQSAVFYKGQQVLGGGIIV